MQNSTFTVLLSSEYDWEALTEEEELLGWWWEPGSPVPPLLVLPALLVSLFDLYFI